MLTLTGEPVFEGLAAGQIRWYERGRAAANFSGYHRGSEDKDGEAKDSENKRFLHSLSEVKQQTLLLYRKMQKDAGEEAGDIFQAHMMILEDPDLIDSIADEIVNCGKTAAAAIGSACAEYYRMFDTMDDPYMRERAADVADISNRLICAAMGTQRQLEGWEQPAVLCTEELFPSEIAALGRERLKAVVTEKGSAISHMAILAKGLKIPTVIGVGKFPEQIDGRECTVDAGIGKLFIGQI